MIKQVGVGLLTLAVLALAGSPGRGQKPGGKGAPAEKPEPPRIRLAPQSTGKPRALAYRLLPDPEERAAGNAAPLWLRAAGAARAVRSATPEKDRARVSEQEDRWTASERALKDLPRKEVSAYLKGYAGVLRLADAAARRGHCDWGRAPLTIESLRDLPLDEIQGMRQLAQLLTTRCRLELSEGRFADAARTLQTGFALARDVGHSDLLIQDLVAIAISSIMLGRVEEWVRIPGSPNLYWALTDLPRPLVNVRRSVRTELNTLYRSFPQLRRLHEKPVPAAEVQALVRQVYDALGGLGVEIKVPDWVAKMAAAGLAAKYYPDAKKYLLAQGRPAREVNAMPAVQVVVVSYLDKYDRHRDDILKWLGVPPWQAWPALEKVEKRVRAEARAEGNWMIDLLLPALVKVYAAQVRLERFVAGLRGAEALRHYAAAHDGKAPAKWADVTEVPLPIDPVTGKGLDAFYRVKGGAAVLEMPPLPGQSALTGRRYELSVKR